MEHLECGDSRWVGRVTELEQKTVSFFLLNGSASMNQMIDDGDDDGMRDDWLSKATNSHVI
jgi:hypothetical protein